MFCKLDNIFLLDLANLKTLLACSILGGCERQIFFNYKWFNAVCNSLPANVISLNKILAMPGLAGTPKDKKAQFIVFKTRTKRIGEA